MGLPRELMKLHSLMAPRIGRIFSRIILPLSGPALATVGILHLYRGLEGLHGPLLYLNDPKQTDARSRPAKLQLRTRPKNGTS